MPKSHIEQLQEAIAKGDLKKAATLAKKLERAGKISPRPDVGLETLDESDYIASSRPKDQDNQGGRTFVGEDGREHVYARRVSMAGQKFVNRFDPKEYDRGPVETDKVDKKLAKTKRSVSRRPPATKVKVKCSMCGDTVEVYPWEAETVDGQKSFRCSKRGCTKQK